LGFHGYYGIEKMKMPIPTGRIGILEGEVGYQAKQKIYEWEIITIFMNISAFFCEVIGGCCDNIDNPELQP